MVLCVEQQELVEEIGGLGFRLLYILWAQCVGQVVIVAAAVSRTDFAIYAITELLYLLFLFILKCAPIFIRCIRFGKQLIKAWIRYFYGLLLRRALDAQRESLYLVQFP